MTGAASMEEAVMKRTLYAGLGMVAWKLGKRYVRQRVRGVTGRSRR